MDDISSGAQQDGAGDSQADSSATESRVTPSNYVYISRSGGAGVKGTWVIDPTLEYPDGFLRPVARGTTRKNVDMITLGPEGIDADIFVVPTEALNTPRTGQGADNSVTIKTSSTSGTLIRIHDYLAENGLSSNKTRRPIHVLCTSKGDKPIKLHLPTSFKGPVKVQAASISHSDRAKASFNLFEEADGEVRGFIGPFNPSELGRIWNGDRLEIESEGPARILFDDESDPAPETKQVPASPVLSGNVYMEIGSGLRHSLGKVEFKLYDDLAPKLCQNFRLLATAKNAPCYRRLSLDAYESGIEGGSFDGRDHSALGLRYFTPERTGKKPTKTGYLAMFQSYDQQCSSRFEIGISRNTDSRYIIFGEVVQGLELVRHLCDVACDVILQVTSCGIIPDKAVNL